MWCAVAPDLLRGASSVQSKLGGSFPARGVSSVGRGRLAVGEGGVYFYPLAEVLFYPFTLSLPLLYFSDFAQFL